MSKTIKELREDALAGSMKTVEELNIFADTEIPSQGVEETDIAYTRRLQLVSAAKQKASFDAFKLLDKIQEEERKLNEKEVSPTNNITPDAQTPVDFVSPEERR